MKTRSKKGFTLAELLIVIAIIAILVAIMFPVFGAQLDKARAAADLANVRATYSELVADKMLGTGNDLTALTTDVTINLSELQSAVTYTGKSVVSYASNKVTVTYTNGGNTFTGSFKTDADVKIDTTK